MRAAAQYLRKAIGTNRKLADLSIIKAITELITANRSHRVFALEDTEKVTVTISPLFTGGAHPPFSVAPSMIRTRNDTVGKALVELREKLSSDLVFPDEIYFVMTFPERWLVWRMKKDDHWWTGAELRNYKECPVDKLIDLRG